MTINCVFVDSFMATLGWFDTLIVYLFRYAWSCYVRTADSRAVLATLGFCWTIQRVDGFQD